MTLDSAVGACGVLRLEDGAHLLAVGTSDGFVSIYALPGHGGVSLSVRGRPLTINADRIYTAPPIAAELHEKIFLKGKMPMDIGLSFLPRSQGEAPVRQSASVPSS